MSDLVAVKLWSLTLLFVCFPLASLSDWGEDPFVYDYPKKENSERKPASRVTSFVGSAAAEEHITSPASDSQKEKQINSQVEPVKSVRQKTKILSNLRNTKKSTKEIVQNAPSANQEAKVTTKKDAEWERIKDRFERGPASVTELEAAVKPPEEKRARHIENILYLSRLSLKSISSYYPTAFDFSAPVIGLSSELKLGANSSGFIGFETSLSGSVKDKNDATSFVSASYTKLELGYRWRREPNSKLSWQVGLREWELKLDRASQFKLSQKVSSLFVGADYSMFQTEVDKLVFNLRLYPNSTVSEANTAWTSRSGNSPSSYGLGFQLSYLSKIDESWSAKLFASSIYEYTNYKGSSGATDPVSGQNIENLKVDTLINQFGLKIIWNF